MVYVSICSSLCLSLEEGFGGGNGTPLQYSCLENPMDGRAWWAAVQGVAKSRMRLSNFTFTFHFHALEKEMATHSSVLAWRIPGTGEPGGLPFMGSHRVGHGWSDSSSSRRTLNFSSHRFWTLPSRVWIFLVSNRETHSHLFFSELRDNICSPKAK